MVCPAQVLSNPELRERYDKHGEQALDVDFMDSAEFFTMLFGSDRSASPACMHLARTQGEDTPARQRAAQVLPTNMITTTVALLCVSSQMHCMGCAGMPACLHARHVGVWLLRIGASAELGT